MKVFAGKFTGKACLLLMGLLFWFTQVQAQFVKIEKEESFPEDVSALLQRSANKSAGAIAEEFKGNWASFSPDEKKKVFTTARDMFAKGMSPVPYISSYLNCINTLVRSKNIPREQVGRFAEVCRQTGQKYGYNAESFNRLFNATISVVGQNAVHLSTYNQLRLAEGTQISFDFIAAASKNETLPDFSPEADTLGWTPQPVEEETSGDVDWGSSDDWDSDEDYNSPTEGNRRSEGFDKPLKPSQAPIVFDKPVMPAYSGPVILLAKTGFTFSTRDDSLKVSNVEEGRYFPINFSIVAKGGKTDWSNLEMPDLTCELDEYHFNIRLPQLKAQHARLSHKAKTDSVVLGVFEYQGMRLKDRTKAVYPRFISYYNNIAVKDLIKDMDYEGGYSYIGRRFSSQNLSGRPSSVILKKDGTKKFRASSRREFVFTDSTLNNSAVAISIYINNGKDSISHPGSRLRYHYGEGKLSARKDKHEYNSTPYFNSYHKVEILADNIDWQVNSDSMVFSMLTSNASVLELKNKVKAEVRSIDFYTEQSYVNLQRQASFNPLAVAVAYGKQTKSTSFHSSIMAQQMKLNPHAVRLGMRALDRLGYIVYDDSTDWVEITRKGVLYTNASAGIVDYDNMELYSITDFGKNITLNLSTYELNVSGVEVFPIWRPSEEQEEIDPLTKRRSKPDLGVWVYPKNKTITIKQNRNIAFDGQVEHKRYGKFWGENFQFHYDSFKITMANIDSLGFVEKDSLGRIIKDSLGQDKIMDNKMRNVSGTLFLAHPRNKSGQMKRYQREAPNYPYFAGGAGAFIAFNGTEIMDGEKAYSDSLIRFDIYAFRLDSMMSKPPEANEFKGIFRTNGIFPNFEEQITVQRDNSFGFVHPTSIDERFPQGYPLYTDSLGTMGKNTAIFNGTITLNKEGLRSSGEIKHLSAVLNSNDFVFFPDSVTSLSKNTSRTKDVIKNTGNISAAIIDDVSFPDVEMVNYKMQWRPRLDSMLLTTADTVNTPFKIYGASTIEADQRSTFKGTLALTSKGLFGNGIIDNKGAVAKSPEFTYSMTRYTARHSEYFKIKSSDPATPALLATNVKIDYDLGEERTAVIEGEVAGEQSFRFPYTQYKTSLGKATWNFDEKKVVMALPEGGSLENSVFSSTRKDQKGLSFQGASAVYDLDKFELAIGGVPFIKVVDSHIFPDQQQVVVKRDADMQPLKNALLHIDAQNAYHKLEKGNIVIQASDYFEGNAILPFKNDEGNEQPIRFDSFVFIEDIEQKGVKRTKATTRISEEENFVRQAGTQFRGQVTMRAQDPNLIFEGEFRYTDFENDNWFSVDPKSNDIMVATLREGKGITYGTGLFLSREGRNLYASYESELQDRRDKIVFGANGRFKKQGSSYLVEAPDRTETNIGNRYLYNKNGQVEFEGLLQLAENNPRYKIQTSGTGKGNFNKNEFSANVMLTLAFEEGKGDVFKDIARQIRDQVDLEEVNIKNDTTLFRKIGALAGAQALADYQRRAERGRAQITDVFNLPLVISSVEMHWSDEYKAFYSKGKIEVSNIFKENINLQMNGYIEIPVASADDEVANIYLEISPKRWYYITYKRRDVKLRSSASSINEKVANPKSKDKFELATPAEKASFISRFRRDYLGLETVEEVPDDDDDDTFKRDDDDDN